MEQENKVTEKFNEFKKWYQSKTIIGIIISSISGVVFALSDGAVDIQGAVGVVLDGGEELANSADGIWSGVAFIFGQGLALWGRLKASLGIK